MLFALNPTILSVDINMNKIANKLMLIYYSLISLQTCERAQFLGRINHGTYLSISPSDDTPMIIDIHNDQYEIVHTRKQTMLEFCINQSRLRLVSRQNKRKQYPTSHQPANRSKSKLDPCKLQYKLARREILQRRISTSTAIAQLWST